MEVKQIKALTDVVDGKMVAIASTENPDRVGDSLKVADWDFKNFKKNPVLLAGHDYRPQYVIGVAKNLRADGNKVTFEPVFHTITNIAKELKQMYEEGILKAWSVGFIPGDKNELLEVSAVAVPANAEALMLEVKSLDKAKQKQVTSQIEDFVSETKEEETPDEEKTEEVVETEEIEEQKEDTAIEETIEEEKTTEAAEEIEETETKSSEKSDDKGPETIEEELNEEEQRQKKYKNLSKVDNLFYAFYKVYLDKDTPVDKFNELVKELSGLLVELAGTTSSKDKSLKDFNGGIEEIYEMVQKEGRVLSGKNRDLITNCATLLKDSASALDNLLEATTSSKKEVESEIPEPEAQRKVEIPRKALKKPLTKEQMAVRILKEIAKNSSYGLNQLKK